jgi:hypothetical protein
LTVETALAKFDEALKCAPLATVSSGSDGGHPREGIASDQCEVPKSHGGERMRNDRQNIRTLLLPMPDYGLFVGIVNSFTACAST